MKPETELESELALEWVRPKRAQVEQPMDETKQMEDAARSARQRLWAADVSCYYAQRRFSQTSRATDRRIWQDCQRETQEAVAAVQEAERALAGSRAGQA